MRKVLLALFATIIVVIGFVGYNDLTETPDEVIEEKDYSTEIKL
ncbi:hypothetical protein ACFOUV_06480 [Oceanobacillus longus]|uniref:Uncharacterized protein n=1 Tax=Oceanobacillus longus TaxID=930120 RepID=A0ABV8GX01_9BACI